MKTFQIQVYTFSELNQTAKDHAIGEHGDFLESIGRDYEDENGVIQWDYTRLPNDEIVDNIEANGYYYFKDGVQAHTTTFTGKHPKAGTTELYLHGSTYIQESLLICESHKPTV